MSRPRKTPAKTAGSAPARAAPRSARKPASLGEYISRQRQLAGISLRKMAERSGISSALLKEIEGGLHHPSQTILQSLAGALRLSAETLYLQAGILDPRDIEESDTVREIRRDPHLTERQRDILAEVYAAFRETNTGN